MIPHTSVWKSLLRLMFKGKRYAVAFDLASIGELQFFRSVLDKFLEAFPDAYVWIVHRQDTVDAFRKICPHLDGRVLHASSVWLILKGFSLLDLYITTEQFVSGPLGVYTLTLFHGQPSKGVTFELMEYDPLTSNDALFMYGPLQRQALQEHLAFRGRSLPPHLSLFDIGYTKSDDLLNGKYARDQLMRDLVLNPSRKTVLYAPAFNEGASMRQWGMEILQVLCNMEEYNILAKLAVDCLQPSTDFVANGGVNWFERIGALEKKYENFCLIRNMEADGALAVADVLITCVSSIGFEFFALGKPVIFIDTPHFFSKTLSDFFPGHNLTAWSQRTYVNGGREFGIVVSSPKELPDAVYHVFAHPDAYPLQKEKLQNLLLYNPGRATEKAIEAIASLLAAGVRSRRPGGQLNPDIARESSLLRVLSVVVSDLFKKFKFYTMFILEQVLINTARKRGYTLTKSGLGFIDAESTVLAARGMGMSVSKYLDTLEKDPRKRARCGHIFDELKKVGVFDTVNHVCEIGAGTGRYLEKIVEICHPAVYEVYETNQGWVDYLEKEYATLDGCSLRCQRADGISLRQTDTATSDLVHCHAVFVYLPLLQTMQYLKECVRVCRPGGSIIFDCFNDVSFSLKVVETWLVGRDRFPVIIPERLLEEFAVVYNLKLLKKFSVIYGASTTTYYIWRKSE